MAGEETLNLEGRTYHSGNFVVPKSDSEVYDKKAVAEKLRQGWYIDEFRGMEETGQEVRDMIREKDEVKLKINDAQKHNLVRELSWASMYFSGRAGRTRDEESVELLGLVGHVLIEIDFPEQAYNALRNAIEYGAEGVAVRDDFQRARERLIEKHHPKRAYEILTKPNADVEGLSLLAEACRQEYPIVTYCAYMDTGNEEGMMEAEQLVRESKNLNGFGDLFFELKDKKWRSGLELCREIWKFYEGSLRLGVKG